MPWANTDKLVVGDSYFASVTTAIELKKIGLRFIGVVKTATRQFPMAYLQAIPLLDGKGDMRGLMSTDAPTNTKLLAFTWVDRERRFFISTAGSLSPGAPIYRERWRQVDNDINVPAVKVQIHIDQPVACELYYNSCGKVDQHNRGRQADLMLERKLGTHDWDTRANHSIFGMVVVDAFKLALGCQGNKCMKIRDFLEVLAAQLIDNTFDTIDLRPRTRRSGTDSQSSVGGTSRSRDDDYSNGAGVPKRLHLTAPTPTKRYKKNKPKHRAQGRCMVCKKTTSHVCRECHRVYDNWNVVDADGSQTKQYWICRNDTLLCMGIHIGEMHQQCIGNLDRVNECFEEAL